MKKWFLLGSILLLSMFTLSSCIVINTNPDIVEYSRSESSVLESSTSTDELSSDMTSSDMTSVDSEFDNKAYKPVVINYETYYEIVNNKLWTGEYHKDTFDSDSELSLGNRIVDYEGYKKIVDQFNEVNIGTEKIKTYYKDENSNYIVLANASGHSWRTFDLIDCITEDNKVVIYGNENSDGVMATGSGFLVVIPTILSVDTEIDYRECYTKFEIENLRNYGYTYDPNDMTVKKPVIYIYPEKEADISIELVNKDKITCSYPKYNDIWRVKASPDGSLVDLQNGRSLYALYYEANVGEIGVSNEGFIVKGSESAAFLEEKLGMLGLNEREAEEFIIYWLPQLESNKYNYIRFATEEEINSNMGLRITPEPDTVIRINMLFKGLDAPINIHEQKLNTVERNGYTVVEWGGTELK